MENWFDPNLIKRYLEKTVKEYEENRGKEKKEEGTYFGTVDILENSRYNDAKNLLKRFYNSNCMKDYKFISELKTKAFNNTMNELGITHLILDEKYNLTEMLKRDIINPIKRGTFIVFGIIGVPGAGKSEFAQKIAFTSREANKKYKHRDVKIHIIWTQSDFNDIMPILKKGDIIWKDEMPKTVGTGARVEKWKIDNVLHVIRKFENTLIFIDPIEINVNIADIHLQTAGMNLKTRTNRFMVLNRDYMAKKFRYLGHIYSKLHDDEEYRKYYENEKDLFIKRMLRDSGEVKAGKKRNVIEVEDMKEIIPLIEDRSMIKKNSYKYDISEKKIFDTIKNEVKWFKKERDIEIYKEKMKTGRLNEDLGEEYDIDDSTISVILKKVRGAVIHYKGKLFEREYKKYLESLKIYDKVIWDGASGKPDLFAYIEETNAFHLFSLKNYFIKKRPKTIKAKEFKPELEKAYGEHFKKNKKGGFKEIKVFVVIFDSNINKTEKIELDYLNPESITLR